MMDRKKENKMLQYEADNLTTSLKYRNIVANMLTYMEYVTISFYVKREKRIL